MKLGLVTAILESCEFEEMMDILSDMGFQCAEVACWPRGKAERRYASVSHMDVDGILSDPSYARHLLEYSESRKVEISALAFYPNTLDPDPEKRRANVEHLMKVIRAASILDVNTVATFIGRDPTKTVEENLEIVGKVWPPVIALAEELGVRIAIENCPMLFGPQQWPGGQNLMTSPANWRKVFDLLKSDCLGLNYDPSHFVWQHMDYIKPLYEFREKIFHIHFKDIKLYPERLAEVGIMAYPLEYMAPKIPGLGDVNWAKFVSALTDIGYDGFACIEVEDRAFEIGENGVKQALRLSKRYLEQYVI